MSAHDPLCPFGQDQPGGCRCAFIARVRADERARWQPQQPVTPHHAPFCWCSFCQPGRAQ